MLQARHRYLQARRNLEYQKLKESEAEKARNVVVVPDALNEKLKNVLIQTAELMDKATCPICKTKFKDKRGLSSHIRRASCEGT